MLGSLWTLYAAFGLVAGSLAPLLERVRVDLGMSRSAIGAALGAWPFVYLFVAIGAGKVLDRVGLRWGLVLGIVGIAGSAFGRAMAQGPLSLWLAVALFGLGGPFISVGAPKLVAEWFDESARGRAVGIYSTASSSGAVVALAVAGPLRSGLGSWRWVLVLFGVVAVVAGIGWAWVARVRAPTTTTIPESRPALGLLADHSVRWVMVMAIGVFFLGHAIGGWMPEMLRTSGWSETGAGLVMAAGVGCGIVGSILLPAMIPPERRGLVMSLLLVLLAVVLWPLLGEARLAHAAVAPVIGTARVLLVPMAMLILMSTPVVTPARMGAAGGLFFTAGEIGGVSGPWLVGIARDADDDFSLAISILSMVALALLIAVRGATRGRLPSAHARAVPDSRPH
jgi:cyanate permease